MNNFDHLAFAYDLLAKIVFGDEILKSQTVSLNRISADNRVLVVGGGTGKILEHIPICESVEYLEKSSEMMRKAQKRISQVETRFIQADFLEYKLFGSYDVIICPFFLDCFEIGILEVVIEKLKLLLTPKGLLIVSDFDIVSTPIVLSRMMHFFFRVFASLESMKLQPIKSCLEDRGFQEISNQQFNNGIFNSVYKLEQ